MPVQKVTHGDSCSDLFQLTGFMPSWFPFSDSCWL